MSQPECGRTGESGTWSDVCTHDTVSSMKRPSSDRHVMKRENSDPVLLVQMTKNTSLGRIVWSLKTVDVKAAQLERPLVGFRD